MKILILGLGVVLAGLLVAPIPVPHPVPQTGPPGSPNPPCCHAVSNDSLPAHVSAGRAH